MLKIALYELKRMLRDRSWLAIFLAQPVIIILLLGSVAIHEPENINVSLVNLNQNRYSSQIAGSIKSVDKFNVNELSSEQDLKDNLTKNKSKSGIILDIQEQNRSLVGRIEIIDNATSPEISTRAKVLVEKAINNNLSPGSINQINIIESKNTLKDIKYFDFFASAVIVLLILIVGLNTSSTTITQERIDGTFERFFVTPYTKLHMIVGKMLAFSTIAIVLSLLTIFSLKLIYAVTLGPIWLVLLVTFLSALTAISLGVLISSFTYTIAESIQLSILCFFSCLILTGLIFQPETMHPLIQKVSSAIPFTYSVKAMREVNILNFNFWDIKTDLIILTDYAFLFQALAVISLKRKAN